MKYLFQGKTSDISFGAREAAVHSNAIPSTSFFLTLLMATSAFGGSAGTGADMVPDRCAREPLGWHFYCDPRQEQARDQPPQPSPEPPKAEDQRPQLKTVQDDLDRLKANMVMDPSEENVSKYIAFQKEQLDRASMVSDVWRRTIWQHPELDYTLERPVNTLGKRTWVDERNRDRTNVLTHLNERYGVFFIYRSDCAYCHALSPVLHAMQAKYGLEIKPVTANGIILSDWPDSLLDRGQIEMLGMTNQPVPALILFDSKEKRVVPIGFGYMSEQDIEERIFAITNLEVGHDY